MDVDITDGYNHSIGAVIDGTNSRALLFIDGEIAGVFEDIPECQFQPGVSTSTILAMCIPLFITIIHACYYF